MTPQAPAITLAGLRDALTELPTIPETLTRILELIEDPNSGARDLADVIRGDAPLSAKVLRLANSPLYHKSRDVGTIQECVSVLGYRTVRQVALCVAVVSSLGQECDNRGATLDYRDLWRHSVAVGATAKVLANLVRHPDPEGVFTGGLLHDLGKFVLNICLPRHYSELIAERRTLGLPLVELERRELGFDHGQAGAALAESWNFPAELVGMIGSHHDRSAEDLSIALVSLADYVSYGLYRPMSDMGFAADLVNANQLFVRAGLTRTEVNEAEEQLQFAIDAAAGLAKLD